MLVSLLSNLYLPHSILRALVRHARLELATHAWKARMLSTKHQWRISISGEVGIGVPLLLHEVGYNAHVIVTFHFSPSPLGTLCQGEPS